MHIYKNMHYSLARNKETPKLNVKSLIAEADFNILHMLPQTWE